MILTGKIGVSAANPKYPNLKLTITTLTARPGTYFDLSVKKPVTLIQQLANRLQVKTVIGSDPAQSTGIFQLSLVDTDLLELCVY